MSCAYQDLCGGCVFRTISEQDYQKQKIEHIQKILWNLSQKNINFAPAIFIGDGVRRRVNFAFTYAKDKLSLGFNRFHSHDIIDIETCPLLLPQINSILPSLRFLLHNLCQIKPAIGRKNKKTKPNNSLRQGDVYICVAANGLDIVLEFDTELELQHRMDIFDWAQTQENLIRISHRRKAFAPAEPIIEKLKPYIEIDGTKVYIPAGTFLQASFESENKLIELVKKYLQNTQGKIADLFCGVGTFSYAIAHSKENKVTAIDSSHELLEGFKTSINKNQISNIEIYERNLFKYPLSGDELKGYSAIVFDPPRAGAEAQMQELLKLHRQDRPPTIVAISCNPHSFIKDAQILLNCGYSLEEVTIVDQFAYSNHSELVALFTLK